MQYRANASCPLTPPLTPLLVRTYLLDTAIPSLTPEHFIPQNTQELFLNVGGLVGAVANIEGTGQLITGE